MNSRLVLSKQMFFNPSWQVLAVAIASTCFFVTKIFLIIIIGENLNHVDGTWTTLATDLRAGIFYRPLFSEQTGYGGTRYMPLFFSLHALAMVIIKDPVIAGHCINALTGLILIVSMCLLLQQKGLKPYIAYALSFSLLAVGNIQYVLQGIRVDILPLACNIFGIVIIQSKLSSKYREPLAALFFVLALFSKITSVHGIVAVLIWLGISKRFKESLRILIYTIAGYFFGFVILYYASAGRIIQIFHNSLSGGGSIYDFIKAPIGIINTIAGEPVCLIFSFWAALIICSSKKNFDSLQNILWVVTLIITLIIFGSPGIDSNHLVDITAISILVIASSLTNVQDLKMSAFRSIFLAIILFSMIASAQSFKTNLHRLGNGYTSPHQSIVNFITENEGMILSENPLLPILAKKWPYVSDAFMLRIILNNNESIRNVFVRSIEEKKYSIILFMSNPEEKELYHGKEWYSYTHFGSDNIKIILNNYMLSCKIDNIYVYVPR